MDTGGGNGAGGAGGGSNFDSLAKHSAYVLLNVRLVRDSLGVCSYPQFCRHEATSTFTALEDCNCLMAVMAMKANANTPAVNAVTLADLNVRWIHVYSKFSHWMSVGGGA